MWLLNDRNAYISIIPFKRVPELNISCLGRTMYPHWLLRMFSIVALLNHRVWVTPPESCFQEFSCCCQRPGLTRGLNQKNKHGAVTQTYITALLRTVFVFVGLVCCPFYFIITISWHMSWKGCSAGSCVNVHMCVKICLHDPCEVWLIDIVYHNHRFTNTNIIHKTPEWTLIAVVLLHL